MQSSTAGKQRGPDGFLNGQQPSLRSAHQNARMSPAVHRPHAVLREGERVMPLELFFDLVFVLALTQCTALMAHHPTWTGVGQAMLILGVLWWSWVGYTWLTSVLNPEEGVVRLVIF